jgi:sialate O-acetylesterase
MRISVFLLLLAVCGSGLAETRLAAVFSDGMVLQQNGEVAIWGWDEPGQRVSVRTGWGARASARADDDGRWRLALETPGAGGPFMLSVKGSTRLERRDVLIGEVWFASGQSNMDMRMRGNTNQPIIGSNEAVLNAANDRIRLFTAGRQWDESPMDDADGEWTRATPETVKAFSAVGYFFAHKLEGLLGVPVGIISSAWGGSNVESWIDAETLLSYDHLTFRAATAGEPVQRTPSLMYNGMLHPFLGYGIRGVIWYQGESNRARPAEYRVLFPAMVEAWRRQWGVGDFPFYYVQIAPKDWDGGNSAFLREAQLQSMQAAANLGMAVTLDVGECDQIHPAEKRTVADRLAYWALAKDYGYEAIGFSGPVYRGMRSADGGTIALEFDYAPRGLSSFGKPLEGFEIAGADRVFHSAQAAIAQREAKVTVWSGDVPEPVAVRYAFGDCPAASLYNTEGLPASSFRTDDWAD